MCPSFQRANIPSSSADGGGLLPSLYGLLLEPGRSSAWQGQWCCAACDHTQADLWACVDRRELRAEELVLQITFLQTLYFVET